MNSKLRPIFIIPLLLFAACASVSTEAEWERVAGFSREAAGFEAKWERTEADAEKIRAEVEGLLKDGLTEEEAVRITLMGNRSLQAAFEEIGIAKAELVQAGFFTNPSLGVLFRFPFGGGGTGAEAEGLFNIADFWRIPIKKKIAAARIEEAVLRVSGEILDSAAEAREAYLEYVFASALHTEVENIRDETERLKDRIVYRQGFGFASDLDIYMAEASVLSAEIEVERLAKELRVARARLSRVLGLRAGDSYTVTGSLEYPSSFGPLPDVERLTAHAATHRPDFGIAHLRVKEAERTVSLEKKTVLGDVEAGLSYSREHDGTDSLGPALELRVPVFDQNRANIAKAEFKLRRAEKELAAKAGMVFEEVSSALEEVLAARVEAELIKEKLLPLREDSIKFAEKYIAGMELSMLHLFEARKGLSEARLMLIRALREARLHEIRLGRALGGKIPQL